MNQPTKEHRLINSRLARTAVSGVIATIGVAALGATVSGPAAAVEATGHDRTYPIPMMTEVHGEDLVERMHEVEGTEEMTGACGAGMDAMGGMPAMADSARISDTAGMPGMMSAMGMGGHHGGR